MTPTWFSIYFGLCVPPIDEVSNSICKVPLSYIISLEVLSQNHPLLNLVFLFLETEANLCNYAEKIQCVLLAKLEKKLVWIGLKETTYSWGCPDLLLA